MKIFQLEDFKNGWVVGDFLPSIIRTPDVEVAVMEFEAGAPTHDHYHAIATEINVVVSGLMKVNERIVRAGDIFVFEPGEVSKSTFINKTVITVIKMPSLPEDKHEV